MWPSVDTTTSNLPIEALSLLILMQGFEIPANLSALHKYLETIKSRQSWQNTQYSDELVLGGWKPKVGSG